MIERIEVEGRPATVAYLTNEYVPTEPDQAEIVKIIFDDGEIRFGTPAEDQGWDEASILRRHYPD